MTNNSKEDQVSELVRGIYHTVPRILIYGMIGVAVGLGIKEVVTQNNLTYVDGDNPTLFMIVPMLIGLTSGLLHGTYLTVLENSS